MTGPELFQKAQDFAEDASTVLIEHGGHNPALAYSGATALAAIAQVYATLAQAAAIIDAAGYTTEIRHEEQWREALR